MGPLHILTDTSLQSRFTHFELAQMAFAGGADVVQYRNKSFRREKDLSELLRIVQIPRAPGQSLVINDDPALAAEVGADGVHVGLEDPAVKTVRSLLPHPTIIGATVHFSEEWEAVKANKIDYIGVGPVFGTQSKQTGLPPLGLEGLATICKLATVPVIAIGSIQRTNLASVLAAGAYGAAILSEFCLADNPENIARELKHILAG